MNRLKTLYRSTIGKKFIAAITGLVLLGFLVGHMAGNLKIFTGVNADGVPHMDEYGQFLKEFGVPMVPEMVALYTARFVLLFSLILHVIVVCQLALQSSGARPTKYVRSKKVAASLPALWMLFTGFLILAFVVFHILHFTTGTVELGTFEHGKVYNNVALSFVKWPVAVGYIAVMLVLGTHLYHGIWSLFQTLGLDNPDRNRGLRLLAVVITVITIGGFIAVPLSFLTGMMHGPYEYLHSLLTEH